MCAQPVICMDMEEARDTLDEYLKDHPEQRARPRIQATSMEASNQGKPDHWPKPRVSD